MRAIVVREFGPFDRITVGEMPWPVAAPGGIVVDVAAAEVNFPDLMVVEGRYQFKPPLPFSPGKTAAGRIAAVGAGVTGIVVGDRVLAHMEYGAYAERVACAAVNCIRLPDGLGFEKAAALGLAYQTAHLALKERAGIAPGDAVLILGAAGGIGIAAIQLAKAFGAAPVIGAARGAGGTGLARGAGADHVIDLDGAGLRDRLRDEVHAVTGGRGADIVIDSVGGDGHAAALRAVAWGGRLVIVGFASGGIPTIPANYLLVKNIALVGLHWSDYRERTPAVVAAAQREIFDLHASGRLEPPIAHVLPLESAKDALALVQDGRPGGRIILRVR